jgi:hypothetical protein
MIRARARTQVWRRRAPAASWLAALGVTVLGAFAIAAIGATERPARADGDDRSAAEAIVKPMASAPSPVTAEAMARTNEALEQATRFRAAGDEAHAKAADGLAREWAETARDLASAAAAEKLAEDRKRQQMQAQAQLERTRALVEEGLARLGRIRAELAAKPAGGPVAVEVHDGEPKPGPKQAAGTKAQASTNGSTP